ncbi:MAG TPA: hypothetical protein VN048_11490 [Verrucomicrobiae bacterium]|jgi:hypothetical protein|nr:hypothetical protein [Verrucomicrobiae bacterium]
MWQIKPLTMATGMERLQLARVRVINLIGGIMSINHGEKAR